ncbi:fungal trichothecene efflux pump [Lophiotrema nucula]|uniref:Fungal trichothecene efflux pump n=1 Tax=Lophiotrema nucula TaxID=690887 RepID=A0A6A5Z0E6_9PLEO|nr:fungal trichothecene efflux pump [Lophiotrema nucula]
MEETKEGAVVPTTAEHHEHLHPAGYEDPHKAALEDNPPEPEKLTLTVILSAIFLGTSFTGPIIFGFITVTPILVQLSQKLGGEDIDFWIPSGWGAAAAVGFSIAGKISDVFGRRPVILVGQALTVIGGIVAATAQSMNQLIAGEVLLGLSIGTVSVAYAGISEILPNKYRGIGLAWTEFNLTVWSIPSTLIGYSMLAHATWRAMFYVAIAYGGMSFVGTAFCYFPPSHPRPDGKTKWEEFKELDFVGAFLFVVGLVVFLFGLNSGGNTYPWSHAGTIAPLILGVATLVAAFVYDFNVAKDPLFPWYLFKNFREFSALLTLVFVAGMVFFAASALNAQTILYLYTPDPIKIGVYSLPSGASQFIGGVILPALVHRIKHVTHQLVFAIIMQTLFFALAALITPHNISWVMAVQFLATLPFGWITLLCYTTASLNVPQKDLGVAIGLIGTFRSVGGSIGSVIFGSIFGQIAEKEVPKRIARAALNAGASASSLEALIPTAMESILGIPVKAVEGVSTGVFDGCVKAARLGYAYSFRVTWLASIPFGVVAICCALSVKDPSRYFTNHVEVHLEKQIGGKKQEGVVDEKKA